MLMPPSTHIAMTRSPSMKPLALACAASEMHRQMRSPAWLESPISRHRRCKPKCIALALFAKDCLAYGVRSVPIDARRFRCSGTAAIGYACHRMHANVGCPNDFMRMPKWGAACWTTKGQRAAAAGGAGAQLHSLTDTLKQWTILLDTFCTKKCIRKGTQRTAYADSSHMSLESSRVTRVSRGP